MTVTFQARRISSLQASSIKWQSKTAFDYIIFTACIPSIHTHADVLFVERQCTWFRHTFLLSLWKSSIIMKATKYFRIIYVIFPHINVYALVDTVWFTWNPFQNATEMYVKHLKYYDFEKGIGNYHLMILCLQNNEIW